MNILIKVGQLVSIFVKQVGDFKSTHAAYLFFHFVLHAALFKHKTINIIEYGRSVFYLITFMLLFVCKYKFLKVILKPKENFLLCH